MARYGVDKNALPTPRAWTNEQGKAVDSVNSALPDDYYTILNVKPTDSISAIKKAYKKLALLCHPDKNGHPGAPQAMQKVTNVYVFLKDSVRRPECYNSRVYYQSTKYRHAKTSHKPQTHKRTESGTELCTTREFYDLILWIIFLIVVCYLHSRTVPQYSLHQTAIHSQVHYTAVMGIRYFTTPDYIDDAKGVFWTDFQIEKQYLPIIENRCLTEFKLNQLEMCSKLSSIVEIAKQKMDSCIELLQLFSTLTNEYVRLRKKHFMQDNGVVHGDWESSLPCSKEYSERYYILRQTWPLWVNYYVDVEFGEYYNDYNISMIEIKIEEIFLSEILQACKTEIKFRNFLGRSHVHTGLVLRITGDHYLKMISCMDMIEVFPASSHVYLQTLEKEGQYLY